MSSIEERVKKIVCGQLDVKEEDVKIFSSFVNDLGADSLDTAAIIMDLEEEFEIVIADEDAEKLTTVQEAIDYTTNVRKRLMLEKTPMLIHEDSLFKY